MSAKNSPGPRRQPAGHIRRIEAVITGIDVGEHRDRADHQDRGCRGDKRVARHDHFVARLNTKRSKRNLDGDAAVGHRESVAGAMTLGESPSEQRAGGVSVVRLQTGEPPVAGQHPFEPRSFPRTADGPGRIRLGSYRSSAAYC
ncbi:MAG: hypothetical protein O2930_12525 [Acidobacteria bacterium]|nr:hypothetical protein [Acidobacteriota bacterium]